MNKFIQFLSPTLLTLQRFFAVNKKTFTLIFIVFEVLITLGWIIFFQVASTHYLAYAVIAAKMGVLAAQAAFLFYLLTLVPGIIRRLQILPQLTQPIGSIVMLYRRHLGISMFLLAFIHQSLSRVLPIIVRFGIGPELMNAAPYELMGTLTLALLFPLWITSNDVSMKILGKNWKRLHTLTYVALFFLFLHVVLLSSNWALPGILFLGLEVLSWVVFWNRKRNIPRAPSQMVQ